MGLGGLSKKANTATDTADDFIKGAKVTDGPLVKTSKKTFKRLTFSLDAETDSKIDDLSLVPRGFRASRSDVVRAAIELLCSQPNIEEIIEKTKIEQK